MIKAAGEEFGGGVALGRREVPAKELVKKTFGEGRIYKAYNAIMDGLFLNNKQATQEAILRQVRADESGDLLAFMTGGQHQPQSPKGLERHFKHHH